MTLCLACTLNILQPSYIHTMRDDGKEAFIECPTCMSATTMKVCCQLLLL